MQGLGIFIYSVTQRLRLIVKIRRNRTSKESLIMTRASLLNYTTRDFVSKTELDLYISKKHLIFTSEVISSFKKSRNATSGGYKNME